MRLLASLIGFSSASLYPFEGLKREIFENHLKMWDTFRDPATGLYCDNVYSNSAHKCGNYLNAPWYANWYSSAATGWGLQINAIEVELGLRSLEDGYKRSLQTIKSYKKWPRDPCTGFFSHWTSRAFTKSGEWSTIDTALGLNGMMFAGKFFGGEVAVEAQKIWDVSNFTRTIMEKNIKMVADGDDTFSGGNAPLSEYAAVSYSALFDEDEAFNKSRNYHTTFHSSVDGTSDPEGIALHNQPQRFIQNGVEIISGPWGPYSTFTPLFAWFANKGFRHTEANKAFWQAELNQWYLAELEYWKSIDTDSDQQMWALNEDSFQQGDSVNIHGKVFGCGAGSAAGGYEATSMKHNPYRTYGPHIMMSFLRVVNSTEKESINDKIEYLWNTGAGKSLKEWGHSAEKRTHFLWKQSLNEPTFQVHRVESVDYGVGVVGYAGNFLPESWFEEFMI